MCNPLTEPNENGKSVETERRKKFLGVKFAPLNIPFQRRLQTLSAAAWIIVLAGGGFSCWLLSFYILFYGSQWTRSLFLIYILWIYCDRDTCNRGGKNNFVTNWMRNCSWWHYFCAYFPLKLVKTVDLDLSRNYLFCSYPHGILSTGVFGSFATDVLGCKKLFPGLEFHVLTLEQHFIVPFFREFSYSFGSCSAKASSLEYLLSTKPQSPSTGRATVLIVGGASEALECKPGTYRIVLKRRKGFVRIALRNGVPLVPVFSFGETDLYNQPVGSRLRKLQDYIRNVTGIAPILMLGRGLFQYSFGVIPHRKPVTVVVGSPLELPKLPEPNTEQVNEYHKKFTDSLIDLFETHKHKYIENAENTFLDIIA